MVAFLGGKNTQRDTETHFSLSLCLCGCNRGIVRRSSQVVMQTQTCSLKEVCVHMHIYVRKLALKWCVAPHYCDLLQMMNKLIRWKSRRRHAAVVLHQHVTFGVTLRTEENRKTGKQENRETGKGKQGNRLLLIIWELTLVILTFYFPIPTQFWAFPPAKLITIGLGVKLKRTTWFKVTVNKKKRLFGIADPFAVPALVVINSVMNSIREKRSPEGVNAGHACFFLSFYCKSNLRRDPNQPPSQCLDN